MSGAGTRAAILTYHSLDDGGSVLSTPPATFAAQMRSLVETGVRVVSLSELVRGGSAAGKPTVAVSFDDGFRSVHEHALPVLAELGLAATVFLVTDYCGKTNSWPSQPAGLGDRPLLGWKEVREMASSGVEFGSHSRTHPYLSRLDSTALDDEMRISRQAVEDVVGRPADTFAYPYGVHDARVREAARKHFSLACGTTLDYLVPTSDRFALERLDMYYFRGVPSLHGLFSRATRTRVAARRALRACRQRIAATRLGPSAAAVGP